MSELIHTVKVSLTWKLMELISKIDRFDAQWNSIEKRESLSLKQLKSIATVKSVGASTRIEGSSLSDEEVDLLLQKIDITKLEERDQQEVVGYFDVIDIISQSFVDIQVSENHIKNLHNILLKYGSKDQWHRGNYKQSSNSVQATLADGTSQIIFHTSAPGYETEDAMRNLIDWYNGEDTVHPLVRAAIFAYDFVSIHPFQDGNGRLSRLLCTFLLLKNGYKWIEYVSLEHEIERRKIEYYRVLRQCQSQRPNEDVTPWIHFLFDSLLTIQDYLMDKLRIQGVDTMLSPREKSLLAYIGNHPGCSSGEIAQKLFLPSPSVKRLLNELLGKKLLIKHGNGPGTNYSIA